VLRLEPELRVLRDDEPELRVLREEPEPLRELRDDEPPELRAEVERRDDEPELRVLRDDPELRELEPLRERDDVEPLRLREDDDELRRRELLRRPVERCDAGISAVATAFVSCGIRRSRNFNMRSSSRRMRLASCAVSLSPTAVASVSIAV
jgi:hypothetical protein